MAETFFTSDLHLGHVRLAEKFRVGPFEPNVAAHDEWLLTNLHETVSPKDDLYILGDVFMGPKVNHADLFARLPGARKFLVRGNHDGTNVCNFGWEWVRDLTKFRSNKRTIVMCHFPLLSWEHMEYGTSHAHGHLHGDLQDDGVTRRLDVGIDAVGSWAPEHAFRPVPVERLFEEFTQRPLPAFRHEN